MPGRLVAWLTLGSALIALVALVYELVSPTEDARKRPMLLAASAMGVSALIGSLPRLFKIDHIAVEVTVIAIQWVFMIFGIRQLMRHHRAEEREEETS